jgi:hypothetical protein
MAPLKPDEDISLSIVLAQDYLGTGGGQGLLDFARCLIDGYPDCVVQQSHVKRSVTRCKVLPIVKTV